MNLFLTNVVEATIGGGPSAQTLWVPQFSGLDVSPLYQNFTSLPYGGEHTIALVALDSANSALSAESSIYTFSSDLTMLVQSADVDALDA